jgi:hypothetical protein
MLHTVDVTPAAIAGVQRMSAISKPTSAALAVRGSRAVLASA